MIRPTPSVESVRTELERILASKSFVHSERLSRLLRFVTEQALKGQGDQLKEYCLGTEVFEKDDSFDPRIDTVVRVEAHRLRSRLKEYYENEGRDDPVLIDFHKGSYVPAFLVRTPAFRVVSLARLMATLRQNKKTVALACLLLLVGLGIYWFRLPANERQGGLPSSSGLPSIAVLPFADLSPGKDQEYFCDGITDELIDALARIGGLRVVSRTSVFALKGKQQDIRTIGAQLNVDAVLEGSVRKAGNRMRITAQVVNVADGYHVWSQTYERDIRDVFAVQEEISRAIVAALRVRLGTGSVDVLARRPTENLEAYHQYLKGRYQWNKRTADGLKGGIAYFEQAIALDPGYALAYVGLADSYAMLASYGIAPSREVMPKAKAAVVKALEIDQASAEAQATLGFVVSFYDWEWKKAEQCYRRAIELNPGYATAYHWYSGCLRALGRLDESLVQVRRAQELDPLSVAISRDLARTLYAKRQYDEAIKQYRRTLDLEPSFPSGYLHLGLAYEAKSMHAEALTALEKARSLPGSNPLVTGGLGLCYARQGRRADAERLLMELDDLSKHQYVSPISKVLIYIGLGENDLAFQWLDKARAERDRWLAWLGVDPVFDNLRSDPRFTHLVREVGLALEKRP